MSTVTYLPVRLAGQADTPVIPLACVRDDTGAVLLTGAQVLTLFRAITADNGGNEGWHGVSVEAHAVEVETDSGLLSLPWAGSNAYGALMYDASAALDWDVCPVA